MCYDISFSTKIELITDYLPGLEIDPQLKLSFEPVIHSQAQAYQKLPVIIFEDGKYKMQRFQWGVIAPYMNTPEKIKKQRPQMCNARSEKILDKSSYWYRIKSKRCLLPVSGIFEHREIKGWKNKVPYYITLKNRPLFCLPCLYNYPDFGDVETGEVTGTFSVVTRAANAIMQQIHNSGDQAGRMPLFLPKLLEQKWLQEDLSIEEMEELLNYEMPENELNFHTVYTIRTTKTRPDEEIKTVAFSWENLPKLGVDNSELTLF